MVTKWDMRYLQIAATAAQWSKDPSTKVGSCIVDEHNRPVSWGYNGFPRGMDDASERYQDREYKIKHVIHAEVNAILSAGRDLHNCTVYITHPPCTICLGMMRQAFIKRVVCRDGGEAFKTRWCDDDIQEAATELGIELEIVQLTSTPGIVD